VTTPVGCLVGAAVGGGAVAAFDLLTVDQTIDETTEGMRELMEDQFDSIDSFETPNPKLPGSPAEE
jgi:hypothetical protein